MKKLILKSAFVFIFSAAPIIGNAQEKATPPKKESIPSMKINFNEKGDKFMQTNLFSQMWFRVIENNPGTSVNGNGEAYTTDFAIKRLRLAHRVQLSPSFMFYVHFGANNFSSNSGGQGVTLHDAWGRYTLIPEKDRITGEKNIFTMYLGTGLHSWNGVSRLTNASSGTMLAADLPVGFNYPGVGKSDRATRQIGIFANGSIEKLAYRVAVNKPYASGDKDKLDPTKTSDINKVVEDAKGDLAFAGYFAYQFFDTEGQNVPFLAGTYLGKKKILNVGAGFYSNKNGAYSLIDKNGDGKYHDISALGVDLTADLPVGDREKDMSLTFYGVYYNYNFGPDYIRKGAAINPGTKKDPKFKGDVAEEGYGNALYTMGTGSIFYTQAGFMLPKFCETVRVQPYFTYTYKNLKKLDEPGQYYDLGANFLFEGHKAKVTLQYSSRQLYKDHKNFKRAGEFLVGLQYSM